MKFLNSARRHFKTVRISPDNLTVTNVRQCPYDDEVLIHQDEFNMLESQRKEIQALLEENEKNSDFKIDYEKQKKMFPELQLECRLTRSKLNKILRNIWMNTRLWRNRLDTPQLLMQIVEPAVESRKEIEITNEMIADFMDAIDFFNTKLFHGDKKRQEMTVEFEDEIQRLEDKLLMTIKELTDITSQKQMLDSSAVAVKKHDKNEVSDNSLRFVSKTRYNIMYSQCKQLEKVRSINMALKGKDWEKEYIKARDINRILRKNLARWTAEIELAKKIAKIVVKLTSFKTAKYAINYHLPSQEQPSVRSLEAIINESNKIYSILMSKRDEAERMKEALKSELSAYEGRVNELDINLHKMRCRLDSIKSDKSRRAKQN